MEFLCSFLRCHLARKPVVVLLQNVACFLRLAATAITGFYNCSHACRLNSSQFLRLPCGQDYDCLCCQCLLFSYQNGILGSTGSYFIGRLTAIYENQGLQKDIPKMFISFAVNDFLNWLLIFCFNSRSKTHF